MNNKPKLFDAVRNLDGPCGYSQPKSSFYMRSMRPSIIQICEHLETWFAQFPLADRADLQGRFRSKHDHNFESAFYELCLHELLRKLDTAPSVHPTLNTGTRPDFEIHEASGSSLVEARTIRGLTREMESRRQNLGVIYDAINRKIPAEAFLVGVGRVHKVPIHRPPSARKVVEWLRLHIASENPTLWEAEGRGLGADWLYDDGELALEFHAILRRRETWKVPCGRILASFQGGTKWGGEGPVLIDAIRSKAEHHSIPDRPYLLALNAITEWGVDSQDIEDALVGPFGIWGASEVTSQVRAVSAILFTKVHPSNVPTAYATLYHNPHAARPYEGLLCRLPQARSRAGRMNYVPGCTLGDLLGISGRWLES